MPRRSMTLASALACLLAAEALAQTADPMTRRAGEKSTRETTLGTLVDSADREMTITGTLGDGGKLVARYDAGKDQWEGQWSLPEGDEECAKESDGTKHWGRLWFKLSEFGRVFTGKYGHCDAAPNKDFSAKWTGK
jgi:hypothetical protein